MVNPKKPVGPLTWTEILADDPFEGEHWDIQSFGSTPSLSPFSSEDEQEGEENNGPSSTINTSDAEDMPVAPAKVENVHKNRTFKHRDDIEALKERQYWREDYVDVTGALSRTRQFDLGDVSTMGPGFQRALGDRGLDNDVSSSVPIARAYEGTELTRNSEIHK